MNNLDHSENQEHHNTKGFSGKVLTSLALAGTLALGGCSNNTSINREYQRQERLGNIIRNQERKLNSTSKERESLIESRIKYALRHNEKLAEYNYLKDYPDAAQRIARLEHSILQLENVIFDLDKKIAKLEDDEYRIGKTLDLNVAKSAGSSLIAHFQRIDPYVR